MVTKASRKTAARLLAASERKGLAGIDRVSSQAAFSSYGILEISESEPI
jgi:acyl-CoA synthetase (NDP forming)